MLKVGNCLLSDLLQERSISQTELAIRLNITKQQINAYINNRNIMSFQTALNVANVLNCELTDLYEIVKVDEE